MIVSQVDVLLLFATTFYILIIFFPFNKSSTQRLWAQQ